MKYFLFLTTKHKTLTGAAPKCHKTGKSDGCSYLKKIGFYSSISLDTSTCKNEQFTLHMNYFSRGTQL